MQDRIGVAKGLKIVPRIVAEPEFQSMALDGAADGVAMCIADQASSVQTLNFVS